MKKIKPTRAKALDKDVEDWLAVREKLDKGYAEAILVARNIVSRARKIYLNGL